MAENEVVLKQRNSLGFYSQFKLLGGRELQIVTKGKKTNKSYSVDLLSLQEKSKSEIMIAWKWLIMATVLFLLTLLLIKILPGFLTESKNLYLGIILIAGLSGSIYGLVQFFKCSHRKQIFYSKNAQVPIVELSVGKPSKEKFYKFISEVESQIKSFGKHIKITEDKLLVGEMKMLRRLSDNGIISSKTYEEAKTRLFTGFDSQVVNRED